MKRVLSMRRGGEAVHEAALRCTSKDKDEEDEENEERESA